MLSNGDVGPVQAEPGSVGLQLGTMPTLPAFSLGPVCRCNKKGTTALRPGSAARAVSEAYLHCHQISSSPALVRVQLLVLLSPRSLLILAGLHTGCQVTPAPPADAHSTASHDSQVRLQLYGCNCSI